MKRFSRWMAGIAGMLLLVGLIAVGVGYAMGGREELENAAQNEVEAVGGLRVGPGGVQLGGEDGLRVDAGGVSIGGDGGIRVDTGGLHVGGQSIRSGNQKQTILEEELETLQELEVEVDFSDITVKQGDGYGVKIVCETPGNEMAYSVENGVLKVWSAEEIGVRKGNLTGGEVIITVPKGAALSQIDLHTDLGDVSWEAEAAAEEAELSSDLGCVRSEGLAAKEMKAESDLGEVTVTVPAEAEGLGYTLSVDLGEIWLNGKKQGSSDITARGDGLYYVEAKSSLGNVELNY